MHIRAERMYLTSVCDKPLIINEVLISKEDSIQIGNYALAIVQSEYGWITTNGVLPITYSEDCCYIQNIYDSS